MYMPAAPTLNLESLDLSALDDPAPRRPASGA
jgi:hypothetical protein